MINLATSPIGIVGPPHPWPSPYLSVSHAQSPKQECAWAQESEAQDPLNPLAQA